MNIVERVTNIILRPKDEWVAIEKETTSIQDLVVGYLLLLALLPALGNLFGYWFFGYSVPFYGSVKGSLVLGIRHGIVAFVTPVVSAFLAAFVINILAEQFDSKKDLRRAMQLVVYSYTPALVAGVLAIIPGLRVVSTIAGLYGLYLLYIGLKPMMQTPEGKVTGYFVVSLLVMIVASIVVGLIMAPLFLGSHMMRM